MILEYLTVGVTCPVGVTVVLVSPVIASSIYSSLSCAADQQNTASRRRPQKRISAVPPSSMFLSLPLPHTNKRKSALQTSGHLGLFDDIRRFSSNLFWITAETTPPH